MECSRRNEWCVGGGRGIALIAKSGENREMIRYGQQWEEERDGASEQSEEVMTRSIM